MEGENDNKGHIGNSHKTAIVMAIAKYTYWH